MLKISTLSPSSPPLSFLFPSTHLLHVSRPRAPLLLLSVQPEEYGQEATEGQEGMLEPEGQTYDESQQVSDDRTGNHKGSSGIYLYPAPVEVLQSITWISMCFTVVVQRVLAGKQMALNGALVVGVYGGLETVKRMRDTHTDREGQREREREVG